ncbi:S66 peptidase family protein [Pedobacter duraquae]|uniref:Muramoyltetrapeptide carboxypeptidase n=1 Tax=Pedobacter duraquae TaxID=425511 RepID=A0A4R6IK55_9SPHI|nr:LD-carboxypeptidase [Pedobacter duraquae]TDO22326.1 muramoyltetrapeptide carboxypeptidase [Pedobacter duraquae]
MDRKRFISSVLTAGAAMTASSAYAAELAESGKNNKIPPYLSNGDLIGITCPAGFITLEDIQPAVKTMQQWGFQVFIGKTVGARDFTYGGTDEERRTDLQMMLDNPDIKAIMCARGGYGVVRILDQLNFDRFKNHPKWLIGFSDITALHCHLERNFGIASIHSKMCNSFPSEAVLAEPIQFETILSIKTALTGAVLSYSAPFNSFNRAGIAKGNLVGGNLSLIETLAGSSSDLKTDGKILFVEDTGEYLYSIDRMFWNLKRSGKLENLAGLIIGGFKVKPDEVGEEFGNTIYDIVMEKVSGFKYPVCFDFPVGHQRNNVALRCGMPYTLEVSALGSTLQSL